MGLDGVEMVMAVEEAFDIRIEASEAEKLLTPRLLIDFVQSKVSGATASVCLDSRICCSALGNTVRVPKTGWFLRSRCSQRVCTGKGSWGGVACDATSVASH